MDEILDPPIAPPSRASAANWPYVIDAVEKLACSGSLDDIVTTVRTTARLIARADGITFVLREGDLCHYVAEDAISPLWQGQRFPLSACISGWCMEHAETAIIPNIYEDPRIPHDAYRPTFVSSLVMTPVAGRNWRLLVRSENTRSGYCSSPLGAGPVHRDCNCQRATSPLAAGQ